MSFFKNSKLQSQQRFRCHDGTYASGLDDGDALNRESLDLNDWKEMFVRLLLVTILGEKSQMHLREQRYYGCIPLHFSQGKTRCGDVCGHTEGGKLFRTETGSTPINK
ncbi:MAG: hypothetical protein CM1200mP18_13940 [Gammaproteobacteria bacterium]|nr:MAG: hypothetical protein CM1200mP18_13940 [Gammaproteobacteria bacterium]